MTLKNEFLSKLQETIAEEASLDERELANLGLVFSLADYLLGHVEHQSATLSQISEDLMNLRQELNSRG